MTLIDPTIARALLEALIGGFAVLGGFMAYTSGFAAYTAFADGASPVDVGHRINEGLAAGFIVGAPCAVSALIIMGWT